MDNRGLNVIELDRVVNARMIRVSGIRKAGDVNRACAHFKGDGWHVFSEVKGKTEEFEALTTSGECRIFLCEVCAGVVFSVLDWGLSAAKMSDSLSVRPSELGQAEVGAS